MRDICVNFPTYLRPHTLTTGRRQITIIAAICGSVGVLLVISVMCSKMNKCGFRLGKVHQSHEIIWVNSSVSRVRAWTRQNLTRTKEEFDYGRLHTRLHACVCSSRAAVALCRVWTESSSTKSCWNRFSWSCNFISTLASIAALSINLFKEF